MKPAANAPGSEAAVRFEVSAPVAGEYDLAVAGGGPSGVAAALAAAREGLRVVLIDSQAQLGGTATSGLVSHWLGGRTQEGEWVVGGVFRDLVLEAASQGAALLPSAPRSSTTYHPNGWLPWFAHGVPLDPVRLAVLLDRRVRAAGIDTLLASTVVGVTQEAARIATLVVHGVGGFSAIRVNAVVDATGDADVAALAGCPFHQGRDEDGLMTPATLGFHAEGIDHQELARVINEHGTPKFRTRIRELRDRGIWRFPYDIFISVQLVDEDTALINTSRLVGVDGVDPASYTDGLMRGRQESLELMGILREHFPGFGRARIRSTATMLGIRETRRIDGKFEMKVDDLTRGATFPDTIGFSTYGWDLPDPTRPSVQPLVDETKGTYESSVAKTLRTPIPYRVMLPRGAENLIVTGRAVSVERDVLGPIRVMAPCMAMGEAAGVAASIAPGGRFAAVDTTALRRTLSAADAIVSEDQLPEITPRVDPVPRG